MVVELDRRDTVDLVRGPGWDDRPKACRRAEVHRSLGLRMMVAAVVVDPVAAGADDDDEIDEGVEEEVRLLIASIKIDCWVSTLSLSQESGS